MELKEDRLYELTTRWTKSNFISLRELEIIKETEKTYIIDGSVYYLSKIRKAELCTLKDNKLIIFLGKDFLKAKEIFTDFLEKKQLEAMDSLIIRTQMLKNVKELRK